MNSSIPKEKRITRREQYSCDFLTVYEDDVILENGKDAKRVVVAHMGAAGVLPITPQGEVVLVKQYRYAIDEVTLEIPAGKKDDFDEEGMTCALREMEEETGYTSQDIVKLTGVYTAIGFSDEFVEIYAAYNCEAHDLPRRLDEGEYIDVVTLPFSKARHMATSGEIKDAKTVIALLTVN